MKNVLLMGAFALAGCDAPERNESPAAPPRVVSGNGVIRGRVQFTGTAPQMKTMEVPCHNGPIPVPEESVLVNANGTLRNVFVYLEGAPPTDGTAAAEPALLDQVDCRYVPHVLGVQVGQRLRVRSSDPTLHNVHALARSNRAFNLSMTRAGDEKSVTFERREFVTVKCDVHPWMTAHVGVFENPWFDVTGEAGAFEITGVPPGSYKLVTWHERYGRVERDVTVADSRATEQDLEYKQP